MSYHMMLSRVIHHLYTHIIDLMITQLFPNRQSLFTLTFLLFVLFSMARGQHRRRAYTKLYQLHLTMAASMRSHTPVHVLEARARVHVFTGWFDWLDVYKCRCGDVIFMTAVKGHSCPCEKYLFPVIVLYHILVFILILVR